MTAQSPTSPLNAVVQKAGAKLASLHMTRFGNYPDLEDAEAIIDDLTQIAKIVDDMVFEVGAYAAEHFGMSKRDLEYGFKDKLFGALDGEGLYLIKSAAEDLLEAYAEDAAEFRGSLRAIGCGND